MSEKMKDDPADNIKLVKAIEKYPCLYNYTLLEYARKDVTDNAWLKVAQEVNEKVYHCKEKWKNLRTVFVRKLKPTRTGIYKKAKKPYYLSEAMQFILPFVKPTGFKTDFTEHLPLHPLCELMLEEDTDDNENQAMVKEEVNELKKLQDEIKLTTNEETQNGKRKIEMNTFDDSFIEFVQSQKSKSRSHDPRKMFLLSLVPEINDLTELQMRQFKRKVLKLIDEISKEVPSTSGHSTPSETSMSSQY